MGAILVALLLSGCVSPGDVTSSLAPNGTSGRAGTIVVYRPEGTVMTRGEPPIVSIGGKRYGSLLAGRYFEARVPEGEITVTAQQAVLLIVPTIPKSVDVAVIASAPTYVRVDQVISSTGLDGGVTVNQQVSIREVQPEEAQADLAKLKLLQ